MASGASIRKFTQIATSFLCYLTAHCIERVAKLYTPPDYTASAWVKKLEGLVEQGVDPADYLPADVKADINDLNIRNAALANENMDDRTKVRIASSTDTIPKSFAAPIRTGYRYTLDEEFHVKFAERFRNAFVRYRTHFATDSRFLPALSIVWVYPSLEEPSAPGQPHSSIGKSFDPETVGQIHIKQKGAVSNLSRHLSHFIFLC